jgi:Na+/solute symporter
MPSTLGVLLTFLAYIIFIFIISQMTRRTDDNATFFLAHRASPWWVVAIGMLGDSISGVTFVSVPGDVVHSGMSYMQLVFGFFLGYIVVAYVLLPLYYRLRLVSIYTYLEKRFGLYTYRTGAVFFLVSKLFGAAAKLYVITLILQELVFAPLGVPYSLTVVGVVGIIWLYTQRGGMGTIIWTDVLQTLCLITTLVLIIYQLSSQLGLDFSGMIDVVRHSEHNRIFVFDDWGSPLNFWKQLISGAFIVIVMTGLDQNMMQKNLTCRNLREARRNMLSYGFGFIPLNFLFLTLGILLVYYAGAKGIALPEKTDSILPYLASSHLGSWVLICFTLGITAASFSNADSALTSLTTSVCTDLLGMDMKGGKSEKNLRHWIHLGICIAFALMVLIIGSLQQTSLLKTIYTAVSYTYGPLLGFFAFGLITKYPIRDCLTPYIALASPLVSYLLAYMLELALGYKVGYEILLFNGLFTFSALWLIRQRDGEKVFV